MFFEIKLELNKDEITELKKALNHLPCMETMEILKQVEEQEVLKSVG